MKSPAVERTIRILDFLATHPSEAFTLSALSRRVGISKATVHAVLAALTEGGYILRDEATKRYALGPALIPLGTMAERALPAVTAARDEARALADRLDVQCVVVWASAHELIYLSHSGVPRASGYAGHEGQRVPLVPPIGTAFMAWADEEHVEAWLGRLGPQAPPQQAQRYRVALQGVRRRGYAVGYRALAYDRLAEIYAEDLREIHTRESRDALQEVLDELGREPYLLDEADEATGRPLAHVSVPVFDAHRQIVLALSLLLDDRFTDADLPDLVTNLLRAAGTVMDKINGRRPDVYVEAAPSGG